MPGPNNRKLKPHEEEATLTLSDRVRRRLAERIISGSLRPGQELDEKTLAEEFDVSRTPVREALRQLAANDLVEWRPRQTAIVATITIPKMVEMFEVMAEMEGFCGRLAARRMTAAEQKELLKRHKDCLKHVNANDREAYHALNRPFHEAIYAGAHNEYLMNLATSLYDRLAPYRAYELQRPGALQRVYREHEEIAQSIMSGDDETAYRLLVAHVRIDTDIFSDLISALNAIPNEPRVAAGRLR